MIASTRWRSQLGKGRGVFSSLRAGRIAIYIVAYLSFGVPAIIAGLLVAPAGLLATVLGYGVAIILTASAGLVAQIRNAWN